MLVILVAVVDVGLLALLVVLGGLGVAAWTGGCVLVVGLAIHALFVLVLPRRWHAALVAVALELGVLVVLAHVELAPWTTDVRDAGVATMLRAAAYVVGGALVAVVLAWRVGRTRSWWLATGTLVAAAVVAAVVVAGYFRDAGLLPFAYGGRVAAYDRLWRNLERYYARWDRLASTAPALRERYRARVIAADDACGYFDRCPAYRDAIRDLLAELDDGHTHVVPLELAEPALAIEQIEDRAIVTRGPWRGAAVVAVDDRSLADALAGVPRYAIAYSAPHTRDRQRYAHLLAGAAGTPVTVTLELPAAAPLRVVMLRDRDLQAESPPAVSHRWIAPGIGYLAVPHLRSPDVVDAAYDALAELTTAAGLVLDLRGNGGGNSGWGDRIVARLITGPVDVGRECFRARHPLRDFEGCWEHDVRPIAPAFRGRIAVLLDGDVASSAEWMALALCGERATCFGATTAGDSGNPLPHLLPGTMLRFSTGELWMRDGRTLNGTGIVPHVPIARTRADVIAGRDPVLEAAVASLTEHRNTGETR